MSHATSSEKRPLPHTPKSYPFRLRLKLKSNIHRSPSMVPIRGRYSGATASCFEMLPLCETTLTSHFLDTGSGGSASCNSSVVSRISLGAQQPRGLVVFRPDPSPRGLAELVLPATSTGGGDRESRT